MDRLWFSLAPQIAPKRCNYPHFGPVYSRAMYYLGTGVRCGTWWMDRGHDFMPVRHPSTQYYWSRLSPSSLFLILILIRHLLNYIPCFWPHPLYTQPSTVEYIHVFDCTHSVLSDALETSRWCTIGCNLPQKRIWHKVRHTGYEYIDHDPFRIAIMISGSTSRERSIWGFGSTPDGQSAPCLPRECPRCIGHH